MSSRSRWPPDAGADAGPFYNALLEDPLLAEASVEHLRREQAHRRLSFGERPLSIALRPNLLSRDRYAAAAVAARAVYDALTRLEKALLADPGLRAQLDLEPEEQRLALADPGCGASSTSSRLDSFFGGQIRYVEYNAESPAGMAYEDNMALVFMGLPAMRAFRKRFRVREVPVRFAERRAGTSMYQLPGSAAYLVRTLVAIARLWPAAVRERRAS